MSRQQKLKARQSRDSISCCLAVHYRGRQRSLGNARQHIKPETKSRRQEKCLSWRHDTSMSQSVAQFETLKVALRTPALSCHVIHHSLYTDARDSDQVPQPLYSDHTPRHRYASWFQPALGRCRLLGVVKRVVFAIPPLRLSGDPLLFPSHSATLVAPKPIGCVGVDANKRAKGKALKRRQHAVRRRGAGLMAAKLVDPWGMGCYEHSRCHPLHRV
jgi:hypothetical protein